MIISGRIRKHNNNNNNNNIIITRWNVVIVVWSNFPSKYRAVGVPNSPYSRSRVRPIEMMPTLLSVVRTKQHYVYILLFFFGLVIDYRANGILGRRDVHARNAVWSLYSG